jgi:hypothetical protein
MRIKGMNLGRYPGLLAFYTLGIAAVAQERYGLLAQLFNSKSRADKRSPKLSLVHILTPGEVLDGSFQQQLLPAPTSDETRLNNRVFRVLREPLRDILPDETAYEDAFDLFEYLVALVYVDFTITTVGEFANMVINSSFGVIDAPIGRFVSNMRTWEEKIQPHTRFAQGGPYPRAITALLEAGLFGSYDESPNYERFQKVKAAFDDCINQLRARMRLLYGWLG